jgi:S-DNA-T family DNA segregation ATPase FtsK/SpoIIIE
MDERYELLADAGCRDIASYNETPFEELCEIYMRVQTDEEKAQHPASGCPTWSSSSTSSPT